MAMNSWMLRRQNIRSTRTSGKKNKEDDILVSCLKKEPDECFKEVLKKICSQNEEETTILSYLYIFVKVLHHYESKIETVSFSVRSMLCCLRISLVHESTKVRSAGLRCIRHTIKNENDIIVLNKLLVPYLISRSFDLVLKNDVERIEAMKLMRKILIISAPHFHASLARSLISLANEGTEGKDRMLRICLATLLEIGVMNPRLFIITGGVSVITRNLLECQTPKIAESLCGVLLLLLDKPATRHIAAINLQSVAAPFCDFHYKHCWKDKNRDERELRLNCSRLALLTILRSWPGMLHFCNPRDKEGFRAIVDVLYLDQLEVRKAVLDLLYELLGLPQPEWTDEVSVALSAVDPCEPQASWRLKEGFIVAEGKCVLPSLVKTMPSTTDMHLALLLYCFLECGLLGALTEVIVTSDTFISVRATILLGEILRLIQMLVPPGCCNLSPSLPALLEYATKCKPQAMGAVTALQQLHKLMSNRPASYSLHLDYILRNSHNKRLEHRQEKITRHKGHNTLKSKLSQVKSVLKEGEDIVKETGVLVSSDAFTWNWNLIQLLLKGEHSSKIDLMDTSHRIFLKKLLEFFMPSQNKYSHMDLTSSSTSVNYTITGIELINFLVNLQDPEFLPMVQELFSDILNNILAITSSRSVHDCLFSPQHMTNTQCQSYFLFIGQLSRTETGQKILNSIEMFSILRQLATTTTHDCYVKLIISSLDYTSPGPCRDILESVLTCKIESSRIYATQFLLILLRANTPNFTDWAAKLLIKQLDDSSHAVFLSALNTLHEACELPDYLNALIELNPDLSKFGEKGVLLSIRFLSREEGFRIVEKEKVLKEVDRWNTSFLSRYVKIAEGDISDTLTLHQRNEDGQYEKRVSSARSNVRKDAFLPPHLFGQLNQHREGFEILISTACLKTHVEAVKRACTKTDEEILKLKAALWALSHLTTSNIGFNYLNSFGIVSDIVQIATSCPVYSVRATAFYCLGLIGTTDAGANELIKNGWLALRHNRHEYWPIIKNELQDSISLNSSSIEISEEVVSLDNPFLDLDISDSLDSTEKPDIYISSCSPADLIKVKQSTLPTNRNPPEVVHKRSLSESKTFGTSDAYDEVFQNIYPFGNITRRERNSSMTESTTSGVSSCDSLQNRNNACLNYLMTLSPIPSSSSLSTLRLPPNHKKSPYRISSNSTTGSDVSSSSLTGSTSNELSIQNLLGYNTIRYIRRTEAVCFSKTENYLFKPPPQISDKRSVPVEDLHIDGTEFSGFTVQKLNLHPSLRNGDKTYIGICLPKILTQMFPEDRDIFVDPHVPSSEQSSFDRTIECKDPSGLNNVKYLPHSCENCLKCCQTVPVTSYNEVIKDNVKIDILASVERLANPVMSKLVKSHLFQLKQQETRAFNDVCLYSETCKMLSESSYRLGMRRFLHELFYDVSYTILYDFPQKILEMKRESVRSPVQQPRRPSSISSPTEFKTLDSLKLTCNDNKFPIKKKL